MSEPVPVDLDKPPTDLDIAEYAVWYARKVRGPMRRVAQRLLDEFPEMRFSEREAAAPLLDRLAKLERENAELRRVLNEGLWDWPSGVLGVRGE